MHQVLFTILLCACACFGQRTYLRADGNSANTYNLINGVLGGTAVEVPDCVHPQMHITQRIDTDLSIPVFNFHSHVDMDNDRCINFDRMRTEIKTYGPSPAHMKCFNGERVSYSWDLRLNSQFQPSTAFTHIFQSKAVGGEDSMPFITLTPRLRGSATFLQVLHAGTNSVQTPIWEGPLSDFAGRWVHITVEYTCATQGRFHIRIKRLDNGQQLMSYTNSHIEMWRTGNEFLRPKWGIYRSLNNRVNLRDEFVYLNNICLAKNEPMCS
ncbi:hypothetical protein HA402_005499 [Bradysia odoriphaga]|nr:hypothetical protein HA402_005499 [Bradysia odoriphaga]